MRRMALVEAKRSCSYDTIGFLPDVQRILAALPPKTQGKWQVGHYFHALPAPTWADPAPRHSWAAFAPRTEVLIQSNNLKTKC